MEEITFMKVVCAWCGKDLGEKPGPTGKVSHGICEDCHKVVLTEVERGGYEEQDSC